MVRKQSNLKTLLVSILILLMGLIGYFAVNYIPCTTTESNLSTCLTYYGTMDIREVVSARSTEDVTFKYDGFADRVTIYYGKMTLNFWNLLPVTSIDTYKDYLKQIGITYEFKDGDLTMYFNGEEIRQEGGWL